MSSPAILIPAPAVPPNGVKKPVAKVAKGSPPPRVEEPQNAPSAFTRRGGRQRRRRAGRKTRRHRGGGKMTVVQKGDRWYIRENADDGSVLDSTQSWSSSADAMQVSKTLKSIKDLTPNQSERRAVAVAGQTLATMKTGGRRRYH